MPQRIWINIGWHVNKGAEHAAEFYTASQFRRYLYRPDVIRDAISMKSGTKALEALIQREPQYKDITVAELIKRAPVDVKIESIDTSNGELTVRLGKNTTHVPERITVYVNGAATLNHNERDLNGKSIGAVLKYKMLFPNKKNYVKVTVENKWAENTDEKMEENPNGSNIQKYETLYITAIGINNYPHDPLKHAFTDASSIVYNFLKLEGNLYNKVCHNILPNGKIHDSAMSSKDIKSIIEEQIEQTGPNDTTIIFLSGHGVTDSNLNYYFLTADSERSNGNDKQKYEKEGTSFDSMTLHTLLDKTMGRRIIIIDTCQAGEVFRNNKMNTSKLEKDMHDLNAIIFSATSSQDKALETTIHGGGIFTTAIIRGLEDETLYICNQLPFTSLQDYVKKEISKIYSENNIDCNNVQKSTAVIPKGMEDFIIYAK